jgi:hypothetical protein
MRVDEVIAHYGTATKAAHELNVTPGAITNWRSRNRGKVPELWARRLHELTRGKLKFDRTEYLDS